MVGVVAFIVYVEGGQRRIPVQYAKRVIGRKVMGGQSSYLPLRVNSGGVIPPIFASSLLAFPATAALVLGSRWAFVNTIKDRLAWGEPLYTVGVRRDDHAVLVLLRRDRFQSDGARGQHAQERRVHSGNPAGAQHLRVTSAKS